MADQINLKPTYAKISRKLESILRSQAPFATGDLANSVRVVYDETGFEIVIGVKYGIYLHRGTMDESADSSSDFSAVYQNLIDKAFTPNPGTGVGGIKPRYWMNFSDSVYEMINDELATAYAEQMDEIIEQELENL